MIDTYKKANRHFGLFVCAVCFATNLSQMPYLINSSINRILSMGVWILLAGVCVLKRPRLTILKNRALIFCAAVFAALYFILRMFNSAYGDSALPQPIFLSMFVLIVGSMVGEYIDFEDWKSIFTAYILSGLIVSINVYMTFIRGNTLSGRNYLYASKNSISQIILTIWILIIMTKIIEKGFWKKLFYVIALIFITYILLMLQSRSTIIGMPIIALWILVNRKSENKVRKFILAFSFCIVIALLLNGNFYDFVINRVMTGGRNVNDINDLSSERFIEWQQFWPRMQNTVMFGHGRDKQESVILTSLLEFGFVGGGMILYMAIYPFIWSIKNRFRIRNMYMIFSSIALVYFTNGIFEQLAPFGPGVKCYMLWFMLGGLGTISLREGQYEEQRYSQ